MTLPDGERLQRYIRQVQFAPLGPAGQDRLLASRVLICGCGALGSVLANLLARSGIGYLRIVDRDYLELNNLQRQVLYDERDLAEGLPKAIAAAHHLRAINSSIEIEPIVADVDYRNVSSLVNGMDVIADGTDNFETRFLLNDAAHRFQIPWVFGGCIGAEGQTMAILPGTTPCLRCIVGEPPPPGISPTCDTAGIVAPIVNVIAAWQAMEVLKLASGHMDAVCRLLNVFDLWDGRVRQIELDRGKLSESCMTCGAHDYEWLEGRRGTRSAVLCGRNSVQLSPLEPLALDLEQLTARLRPVGQVSANPFLVRLAVDGYQLTIFPDGRAIVSGTADPTEARAVFTRYVGL